VLDDESLDWSALARSRQTVVFYMGVGHLQQIVLKLRAAGASAEQAVAVVERATLPEQRTLRGTLETIVTTVQAANVQPPALLIVGDVTALAAADSMMGSELGAFV